MTRSSQRNLIGFAAMLTLPLSLDGGLYLVDGLFGNSGSLGKAVLVMGILLYMSYLRGRLEDRLDNEPYD